MGQDRTDTRSPRRPLLRHGARPLVHHPGVEPLFDVAYYPPVRYPVLDESDQPFVVYGVIESLNVCIEHPTDLEFAVRTESPPRPAVGPPGSRSRCLNACTGSPTARGRWISRACDTHRLVFRLVSTKSTPRTSDHFAAQYLACTSPCQRFTGTVTPTRE